MKKTSKTVFLFVLLFSFALSTIGYASQSLDLDLSEYTDEEIVELLSLVNQEIVDRHIEKTATLPEGTYTIGVDIPAGKYIYTPINTDGWWGNITLYNDDTQEEEILHEMVDEDGKFYIVLQDGNVFVSDEEFNLTIRSGALFE